MAKARWAAVPVAVLLTACGPPVPGTQPVTPPAGTVAAEQAPTTSGPPPGSEPGATVPLGSLTDEELVGFGRQLTAALSAQDAERWLSLFELPDEAVRQQRNWYAAVHAVPMDVRELHPVSVRDRDVDGEDRRALVEFGFRHQISGADAVPAVQYYDFVVERRVGGRLVVTEVGGDADQPEEAYPQLWDLAPVAVVTGEAVTVLTEEQHRDDVEELLPALDTAAAAVLTDFDVEGVERMVVSVVPARRLSELFGVTGLVDYAGFATPVPASSEVDDRWSLPVLDSEELVASRIVLDLGYTADELGLYDELPGGSPLLRHEGVHLAEMLREPEGYPPSWAVEGVAGWYEAAGSPEVTEDQVWWYGLVLDEQGLPESLPPSLGYRFFTDDAGQLDRNYLDSAMVFRYVEQRYGRQAVLQLSRELHGIPIHVSEDDGADQALERHLGTTLEQFEQDWVDWVAQEFGSG